MTARDRVAAGLPRASGGSGDQRGQTTFAFTPRGITDAEGAAEVVDDAHQATRCRVVLVTAEDHAGLRLAPEDPADARHRPVVMRRIPRDGDDWQLARDGAPPFGEATVSLGIVIDDAISTGGGGSFVIEDGRLPRSAAEPGDTRVLTVAAPGRRVRAGRVTLPPSGSIEIAALTDIPDFATGLHRGPLSPRPPSPPASPAACP